MFKSSQFLEDMGLQASHSLTPIRDYANDYFHKDDDKLPLTNRFPYGKPVNYVESARGSMRSHKRPASLVLDDQIEPFNKNSSSPLNKRTNSSTINDHTLTDAEGTDRSNFFGTVRHLFESETAYIQTMEAALLIYRRVLHGNRSFKNKLIQQDSHDELLLFGNIETISSISRLFLSALESNLSLDERFKTVDYKFWDEINNNHVLQNEVLRQFDVGKAFNLHFLRIKSTYLSYSVSHRKQKELLELLRAGNPQLFQKWYECCLESADTMGLDDIFEAPIRRLEQWSTILTELSASSQNILSEEFSNNISNALLQYKSFAKDVANETMEFNNNAMYDFSLTPGEIIQSYGFELQDDQKIAKKVQKSSSHSFRQDVDNVLLDVKFAKRESRNTASRSNSIFSGSSSRYSGDSTIVPPSQAKAAQLSPEPQSRVDPVYEFTLADHVTKLKKVHRGLLELKNVIGKEDMLSILDINLKQARLWEAVNDCEAISSNEGLSEGKLDADVSMYTSHIEKLMRQREEATMMKLEEMEKAVKTPLSVIINHCEGVRSHLRDFNALKKDYLSYLREKSSSHDVKREILGKHFEHMQVVMLHQLPRFIELVHKAIEAITLNYHKKLLRYLEISAGGEKYLIEDLESLGLQKRDVGKNYDILESYSASRYHSKRMVRDDWQFAQDPTASRVLRKLFEL